MCQGDLIVDEQNRVACRHLRLGTPGVMGLIGARARVPGAPQCALQGSPNSDKPSGFQWHRCATCDHNDWDRWQAELDLDARQDA